MKILSRAVLVCAFLATGLAFANEVDGEPTAEKTPFLIKPYLYSEKGEKIVLSWQYKKGQDPNPNSDSNKEIKVTLTGLGNKTEQVPAESNGKLYRSVLPIGACGFGDEIRYHIPGMTAPVRIQNFPCADVKQTIRVSMLSDTQMGMSHVETLAANLKLFPASAVFHTGDIVQRGDKYDQWGEVFNAMSPVISERVLVPAVGNHEYRKDEKATLWETFFGYPAKQAQYVVDMGPARFIIINSCFEDDASLIRDQIDWLKQQLAVPARWKFVLFHHAPYSSDFLHKPSANRKEHIQLQEFYVPIFEAYKVDVVFNGHTHIYERSYKSGVHYVTSGPAGGLMGLYGGKNPYSVLSMKERTVTHLQVSEDNLHVMTENKDRNVIDSFMINKAD